MDGVEGIKAPMPMWKAAYLSLSWVKVTPGTLYTLARGWRLCRLAGRSLKYRCRSAASADTRLCARGCSSALARCSAKGMSCSRGQTCASCSRDAECRNVYMVAPCPGLTCPLGGAG